MFRIEFSTYFSREYAKLIKRNKILERRVNVALLKLEKSPESVSHKVGEVWSCRVTGDIRIIWEYKNGELVLLLLKIGGHNDVY